MKKTTNTNSERNNLPKTPWAEYRDMRTFKKIPVNPQIAYDMAKDLCEKVQETSVVTISALCNKIGVKESTFRDLCSKFPILQDAFDYARSRIGDNREVGALYNELNGYTVAQNQAYYCEINKSLTEWRASLKNQEDKKASSAELLHEIVSRVLAKE